MKMYWNKNISLTTGLAMLVIIALSFGTPAKVQSDDKIQINELAILFHSHIDAFQKEELIKSLPAKVEIVQEIDNYMLISICDSDDTNVCYDFLLNSSDIISAVDYNTSLSLTQTNDTYWTTQWAIRNKGTYDKLIGRSLITLPSAIGVDLNLEKAYNVYSPGIYSNEVIVAVIDTGVDNNHVDLRDSMWINTGEIPDDGIDNDGNGYIDDIFGWDFYSKDNTVCHYQMDDLTEEISASFEDNDNHGTHIAGIIAASANNNEGIAGVASNVNIKIMSLKIHGGPNGKGTISDAILAIKYANRMGAKICNLSWGSDVYNKALEQAIKESPMLFVTAAGNEGNNNDTTPIYPANYRLPNIITVSFINPYGALTQRSNYGKANVDIAAPGTDILSTVVGSYATMSGSSMAAPYITGLAAMVYSYNLNLDPVQVKEVIVNHIKTLPGLENSIKHPGIPDAYAIIQALPNLSIDTEPPTLNILTSYLKEVIELSLTTNDNGGSGVRILSYLPGRHKLDDFKNGVDGILIERNTLTLTKAGWYTFYLSDYAGNESLYLYEVLDDTKAPTITSDFYYSIGKQMLTIDLKVQDKQSGISSVKYLPGIKTLDDFKAAFSGIPLELNNGKITLRFTQADYYTIYAIDYRGNRTIHIVDAVAKPISTLNIQNDSFTLAPGDTKRLSITYAPSDTTEKIYFTSSNPSIISVSQWGMVHAHSAGKAVITVRASGGISRKIVITVK